MNLDPQDLRDLVNLAASEAQRWKAHDEKTARHWFELVERVERAIVYAALDEAQRVTKPLRDKALEAEHIPQGLMEFRMQGGSR